MINSRFEDLERRCKKIRNKKIIKIIVYVLLLASIGLSTLLISKNYMKPADKKDKIDKQTKIIQNDIKMKKNIYTKLTPPVINIPEDIEKPKKLKKQQKIIKKKKKKLSNSVIKKSQKQTFKLVTKETNEETILLKNYNVYKDFDTSLKLANYYLKEKNYLKALYWAKIANKLDSTKDSSWIVYAKAKFALGQKEDAIRSLQTFLNIFDSQKVDKLLELYKKAKNKKVYR